MGRKIVNTILIGFLLSCTSYADTSGNIITDNGNSNTNLTVHGNVSGYTSYQPPEGIVQAIIISNRDDQPSHILHKSKPHYSHSPQYSYSSYNDNSRLYDDWLKSKILQVAYELQGVPYVFGGDSLNGMDCSSFVQYVFAQAGIYLPRTAEEQAQYGRLVLHHLKPGDLLFFQNTYKPGISHVGIYIGNGLMIDASSIYGKVVVENVLQPYLIRHFAFAKRLIP